MHERSSGSVRIFYRPHSRADILTMLRDRLPALTAVLPLRRVMLFGSTARERHTIASDIDLLVVYAGEPRADAYALVRETLGIRGVEPHCYTESEAEAMAPVLARMVAGGIDLPFERAAP